MATDIETGDATDLERERLEDVPQKTIGEKIALFGAGTAIATSVGAMALVGSPLVIVAGLFSSGIGGYVYLQQSSLADVKALMEAHEAITKEVDHLSNENGRLEGLVEDLSSTVGGLEDIEAALDVITAQQNASVEDFKLQIEENKKILAKMESNLKGNVLQNMLSVIMRCDKDGDFSIDDNELEELIDRMNNMQGVTLYEDRFRKAIKDSGGSLKAVMGVVRSLLMDEDDGSEPIFTLNDD